MAAEHEPETSEAKPAIGTAMGGLAMRSLGPAFMGGRIADIAVHPARRNTWYVAVGSGGVWKTVNAGTTWQPIFEDQPSYSIGCVTIDPNRPETVWVGTGEAVSGRHVGWGDGVYRSRDGGRTWAGMGLERSEHIAAILVDPRDSRVVYVAAEGPLWSSGGQRGLYKTIDSGSSWTRVLHVDDDTGVTSVAFAPDDPDTVYATTYQRRRRVWSFLGSGPGSGIHVSNDGGATWRRMSEGLPAGHMGKIGLAVTPAAPDTVYATIEADADERGFYRSTDRGESWQRRNEYISGGTGPHYYQEIFASPTDANRIYQVDVFVNVTRDGGATFAKLETGREKHSDNHTIWIDPDNGDHLLVGTDAGLYETFDDGATFRHFPNLAVSQFYRVALDNSEPFYNILGGAQDLGTLFGPSRTTHIDGVRNQDWSVVLGADGYHVAFDPDDPSTSYLEWQVGNVMRHDRRTMELQDIQPQPAAGDPPERWNWDTPILVSPHASNRIYLASQRLWRSDDRGDTWQAVSPDLTTNRNRYELATTERVASIDAGYDHAAMSLYATITSLGESPVREGLLYAGTDDGVISVSEDGGTSWRRSGELPDLPVDAFINDVTPGLHDADSVFAAADAHKNGDYSPYLFESVDRGRTWRSIRGDLPDRTIVWAIEQDHVDPDLLFAGTEFGLYVSLDRGERWHKLTKDVPTIAFRSIALHRRDDDLVGASFGRGFYILDDYGPLRELSADALAAPATLFSVRDAWWYVPYQPMQAPGQVTLGSSAFRRPNPAFGATFTYHLAEDVLGAKKQRRATEKRLENDGDDVTFPGWESLWTEQVATDPMVVLIVRDEAGAIVRQVAAESTAGLHRTSWDLRRSPVAPTSIDPPGFLSPWEQPPRGPLVGPGTYSVELALVTGSGAETLSGPQTFAVKSLPGRPADPDVAEIAGFTAETASLARAVAGATDEIDRVRLRIKHVRAALLQTPDGYGAFVARLESVHRRIEELARQLGGDPVRDRLAEADVPSIRSLVDRVATHHWDTTQHPTAGQRAGIERARQGFETVATDLASTIEELGRLVTDLDAAGAPFTPR